MTEQLIYEASVYSRTLSYKNFKGETKTEEVTFALSPMELMTVIAGFTPKKSRSRDPRKHGQDEEMTDQQQLEFVKDLALRAAGFPSDDGESWIHRKDFGDEILGQAFLTKLTSSDGDRREFAEKVILAPFRAFVDYAVADTSNTPAEVQQFRVYLTQLENIFKMPDPKEETREERAARLEAELQAIKDAETN